MIYPSVAPVRPADHLPIPRLASHAFFEEALHPDDPLLATWEQWLAATGAAFVKVNHDGRIMIYTHRAVGKGWCCDEKHMPPDSEPCLAAEGPCYSL